MSEQGRESEGAHPPGPDALWHESWYVDFADDEGRGGFLRLGLVPGSGVAWVWAAWAEPDGSTVVVRDHDVSPPRSGLEVRAGGLWADLVCETPMSHWSVGLEAFGLAYDDPAEGWAGERGHRVPLGFDLEWEAAMPPFEHPLAAGRAGSGHYQHAGRVHGEVLVGDRRLEVDGWGERDHAWGVRDWWSVGWHWAAFRVGSDLAVSVARPDRPGPEHAKGYMAAAGEDAHAVVWALVDTTLGEGGLPVAATYELEEGRKARAEVVAPVALLVPRPDGPPSRLARALCRFDTDEGGGTGWAEWLFTP